ncbi:unnamed protein product, partial [Symbiodinium sp. CCMP2456]
DEHLTDDRRLVAVDPPKCWVPTPKPGKGKGGQVPEGKGKGVGGGGAELPADARPLNMMWSDGPDEAPMLAVEMDFGDIPEPPIEEPDLTEGAIYKRMWRMFRPRADGSYLLPDSVVQEYQNKTTRPNIVRAFERCGYDSAKFVRKVNKTLEDIEEVAIEEDWEFLTEDEMKEANWSETTLYDNKTMHWANTKVTGVKKKTNRSIVRRIFEDEEEGTIEDKDLVMDWGNIDMQGAQSSLPAGGTVPSLDGVDKKTLQCFPDLEKVSTPSSIVPKAGAAVQKCLAKLSAREPELSSCVETELVKKMNARIASMYDSLSKEDADMNVLYEQGMIDGYNG